MKQAKTINDSKTDLMRQCNNNNNGEGNKSTQGKQSRATNANATILNDMHGIQNKTGTSLQRTKEMIAASKQVGELTLEEQLKQREQIRTIGKEINRVDNNLKRSDKLLKVFRRRMVLWRW